MPFQLLADLEERSRRWTLEPGESIVGSGADSDVRVDHPTVSRRHLLISTTEDSIEVEDLDSRNGTWIGSRRIERRRRVEPGTPLTLGGVTLQVERIGVSDLRPAIAFQHSEGGAESVYGPASSTAGAAPLDRFVLEELPGLIDKLRDRAGQLGLAQAVGSALWRCLPAKSIEIVRDGEGMLFSAGAEAGTNTGAESDALSGGVIEAGPIALRVVLASPSLNAYYEPLLATAASLVEIADERGFAPQRAQSAARPTSFVALPEPATVVPAVVDLYEQGRQVARGDIGVLILGESGVGKEVFARFVHEASGRDEESFVALNCAALPRDLLEMELFGIEKGVATGVEARAGKFELADGGTLFLDEIGDMALETQAKILRVLQEGEVSRIGGREPRPAKVRVLSATHRDPKSMIDDGRFRLDLYHRIAGWTVTIPPLRRRVADIANLAAYFLENEARSLGIRLKGISEGAVGRLTTYPWPGNVRELAQEMARAALFLSDGELLTKSQLSQKVSADGGSATAGIGLESRMKQFEREVIEEALGRSEGNVTQAAERLGVPISTLYRRLKAVGIERKRDSSEGET